MKEHGPSDISHAPTHLLAQERLFTSKEGLTVHPVSPYAKDGSTIFMAEQTGESITPAPAHPHQAHPEESAKALIRSGITGGLSSGSSEDNSTEYKINRFPVTSETEFLPPPELIVSREAMLQDLLGRMGWSSFAEGQRELMTSLHHRLDTERQKSVEEELSRISAPGVIDLQEWVRIHHAKDVDEARVNDIVAEVVGRKRFPIEADHLGNNSPDARKGMKDSITETLLRTYGTVPRDEWDEEVLQNAQLSDEERKAKAWDVLIALQDTDPDVDISRLSEEEREEKIAVLLRNIYLKKNPEIGNVTEADLQTLKKSLEAAIINAHELEGDGVGKDGTDAGVYNFTHAQLVGKARILTQAGFGRAERDALIEAGITGRPGSGADERGEGEERSGLGDRFRPLDDVMDNVDDPDAEIGGAYTPQERQRWRNYISKVQSMPNPNIHALDTALEYIGNLTREDPAAYEDARRDLSILRQEKAAEERAISMLMEQGLRREDITPEQIELAIEQIRPVQSIPAQIEKRKQEIERTDDLEVARNNFAWFRRYVNDVYDSAQAGTLKVKPETQSILEQVKNLDDADLNSIEEIRQWTNKLTSDEGVNIKKFFNRVDVTERRGRGRLMIQSLEDLVELISESQGGEFAPGKKYAVINERGEVQLHNLVAWIRNRILFQHNADPDSAIQPLNQISVPTFYGQINLMSMLSIPAYFQKRQVVIEGNEGESSFRMRVENLEDKTYNQFKEDLLYEAWLFGVSHSNDALYREKREREDEIFNVIAAIYAKNEFTKGRDRLLNILQLAKSNDPKQMMEHLNREKQGSVGKAIARSIMAYYYMAELVADESKLPRSENMFIKNFGEEGMTYFYRSIVEQVLESKFANEINEKYPAEGSTEREQERKSIHIAFERRGELSQLRDILAAKGVTGISQADLDKYNSTDAREVEQLALSLLNKLWRNEEGEPVKKGDLNIFSTVTKAGDITNLIQKAITDTSGKIEGLSGDDIEYAGTWAFTMRNWTGIAAKNDTNAIGFDAWSKLINFGDYRVRQASGREGGGNLQTLWGIRRLGLSFLDGLIVTTESGERKSLAKVIEASVQHPDEDIESFSAPGNGQRQFAGNHVGRGYQLLQFILDKQELKMDSFLSVDRRGYLVFDHVKAQELMGGPYKYMRYCFDQLDFPMEDTIRDWYTYYKTDPETGKLIKDLRFEDRQMKHYFFNNDVWNMDMYHDEYYAKQHAEHKVARDVFAYMLAMEMKVHRTWGSTYPRWSIETIQEIQHFFANFSQEVGIKIENGKEVPLISRSFFTAHEWRLILDAFNSPYWKMYTQEYLVQAAAGFGGGFLKAFVEMLKQIAPMPKAA